MPTNPLLARLCQIYAGESIRYPQLKAVTLAQWLLESGRATSKLAKEHYNFGGLKWRPEMRLFATRTAYQAHDGLDYYCKFATIEAFVTGYWAFLNRAPYSGWESHTDEAEQFIRFIGPIYCPTPGYVGRVLALLPEAGQLLDAAEAEPRDFVQPVAPASGRDLGTIVIDPGHGGVVKMPGSSPNNAISVSGVKEKKLTLDFCLILRDELLRRAKAAGEGLKVVMTRSDDRNLPGAGRARFAYDTNAKAFLSVHFNGGAATTRGAETFYGASENGNINLDADKSFANDVQAGLVAGLQEIGANWKHRGVKPDTMTGVKRLAVLSDVSQRNHQRSSPCCAALTEIEYITNPTVDRLLISGPDAVANRTKVMGSVAKAILGHLRSMA